MRIHPEGNDFLILPQSDWEGSHSVGVYLPAVAQYLTIET